MVGQVQLYVAQGEVGEMLGETQCWSTMLVRKRIMKAN